MITIHRRALVMLVLSAATAGAAAAQLAPAIRAQAARKHINLPSRPVQAPFSDGVLVGNTLYLAGRIGLDPATGKPPAEVEAEVRLLLDGLKATLTAAGMTMDDLVSVQIFCSDVTHFDAFNRVYRTYFSKEFPARAFLGAEIGRASCRERV